MKAKQNFVLVFVIFLSFFIVSFSTGWAEMEWRNGLSLWYSIEDAKEVWRILPLIGKVSFIVWCLSFIGLNINFYYPHREGAIRICWGMIFFGYAAGTMMLIDGGDSYPGLSLGILFVDFAVMATFLQIIMLAISGKRLKK